MEWVEDTQPPRSRCDPGRFFAYSGNSWCKGLTSKWCHGIL